VPEIAEIIYAESTRAITAQEASLDELRSRTGVLLAALSVSTSFLGAQTATGGLGLLGVIALLTFAAAVGACLYVLRPQRGWVFDLDAEILAEDWIDEERDGGVTAMQRFIAESREGHLENNQKKLDSLYVVFQVGAIATLIDVLFWVLQLST